MTYVSNGFVQRGYAVSSGSEKRSHEVDAGEQLELGLEKPEDEHGEIRSLLKALSEGKITEDQVVSRLMMLFQLGIGSAAYGLAELDKVAARKLGERLSRRVNNFLSEVAADDHSPEPRSVWTAPAVRLENKKLNVLKREYVLFKELNAANVGVSFPSLIEKVRACEPNVTEAVLTAQLDRLIKSGLVTRERKGYYGGSPRGKSYLEDLASELEARGENLPTT